jgi:hypothetical protein
MTSQVNLALRSHELREVDMHFFEVLKLLLESIPVDAVKSSVQSVANALLDPGCPLWTIGRVQLTTN